MRMICPKCHRLYNDDDMYCIDCGLKLVRNDVADDNSNPVEKFSNKVKTSKPQKTLLNNGVDLNNLLGTKLDILIIQNKELIRQDNRIIELLEKKTN